MELPMRVEGMIDLQTLGKIYEALCMSEDHDDAILATWVKEHYIRDTEGRIEGGCEIRSAEGFEKLYNAYKRVRVITNRAQDKWPFFDRRWKSMNATTVRSLAQGEMDMTPSQGYTPDTGNLAAVPPPSASTAIPTGVSSQVETAVQPRVQVHSATLNQNSSKQPMDDSRIVDADRPLFAADAEPEHTNLDDLPSSSAQKRKHVDHKDDGTFARGHNNLRKKRRGGKGGRPRKDRSLVERAIPDEDFNDHTPSTFDDILSHRDGGIEVTDALAEKATPKSDTLGTRITRGTTRPSNEGQTSGNHSQKPRADSDTTAVNEQDQTAGSQSKDDVDNLDNDSVVTDPTDTDLLTLGLSLTTEPLPSTSSKPGSTSGHVEQTQEQDTEDLGSQNDDSIEYFARVHTSGATLEIPLESSALGNDREKLESRLLAYVAWKKDAKAEVSFETWSSIFMLGR
ncbi:hypothetical protein N0V90_010974 [Kalmusia sp. IMI 367209]|nr:hypothetical protein N0V90_010974 [Kalmusia sp. IMI 367209]